MAITSPNLRGGEALSSPSNVTLVLGSAGPLVHIIKQVTEDHGQIDLKLTSCSFFKRERFCLSAWHGRERKGE